VLARRPKDGEKQKQKRIKRILKTIRPAARDLADDHRMALSRALLVLSAVWVAAPAEDGGRTVLYPKHKSGGLACYQDRRWDGGAFWTYADRGQRRRHAFHCPSSLSAWCANVLTGQLSVRGCSGPTGVNRAGCFRVVTDDRENATSRVCLCKRDYCNAAAAGVSSTAAGWLVATALMRVAFAART